MATNFERKQLNVCFIGHVDSGKSTTAGQLAVKLGAVDKRTYEKHKAEAELAGKGSFALAYIYDKTKDEKERGITINTTLMKVHTKKYDVNILDCPGHKDFIKNMVTGAAQSDVGVVVVPASDFESCVGKGGILKEHIVISNVFGCKYIIVCVNKMDEIEEGRRPARFEEIRKEMRRICAAQRGKQMDDKKDPVIIIPISAYKDIGITETSAKFDWFSGWLDETTGTKVYTLEAALDWQKEPARLDTAALRMPIVHKHKISGIGDVFTGRVDAGIVKPGMQVSIEPAGCVVEVKSVEIDKVAQTEILPGQNCGIAFKKPTKGDLESVIPGHVISDSKNNPVKCYKGFVARMAVVNKPKGLTAGYTPLMELGVPRVPVTIEKLLEIPASKARPGVENPERLSQGNVALVVMVPHKPTVFETKVQCPTLSRFALFDGNQVVCVGSVEKLLTEEQLVNEYQINMDKYKGKGAASSKKVKNAKK